MCARPTRTILSLIGLFLAVCSASRAQPSVSEKPAPSQASPALSLADLEQLALRHNPTLAQAAAYIEASRGKAQQAGLPPNPVIGYVGDQIGIAGTAGELQGGFVQQTIVTAGKLRLSRAKYNQEAVEAELRALAQQWRVLNGVRLRYCELLAVQQTLAVREKQLENGEENLRTHKEMFNTGQANQAEVLLAEVALTRARTGKLAAMNRARAAWEALVAVVGAPHLPCMPLAGSLEPDGPPLDWEASLCRLLQESPEIQAARAHLLRDEIALKREKIEPIPDLDLSASVGKNFETNNTVAGVQLGIRLPVWDRNQGSIRQAQADLMRSRAEVTRLELSLRQRLAQVFSQYQTARETAELFRSSTVPRTAEAHETMAEMYKKRRAPWIEVVKFQQQLLEVQAEYTHTLLELRRAEVSICGLLLVDGLSVPEPPASGGHLEATPRPR